jgi:hypothetical protein
MASMTNYTVNKFLVDTIFRGQTSPVIPTTLYYGLFVANAGYALVSTAYTTTQFVLPATPNGHIYKCTTAGTSGGTAPTWPTTPGSTVADGTVVWTEQTTAMLAGTFTEATYTGYARVSQASSLANWAGTQSAGSTAASSGTSGVTSNNNVITFGAPTSAQTGVVAGVILADASTAGDIIAWSMLTNPKTINNGDAAPNFPAAAFTFTWS